MRRVPGQRGARRSRRSASARALARIAEPLETLRARLLARLDDEAEDMDAATRNRIEAIGRSLAAAGAQPAAGVAGDAEEPGRAASRTGPAARAMCCSCGWTGATDCGISMSGCIATGWIRRCRSPRRWPRRRRACWSPRRRCAIRATSDPEIAWAAAEARVGAPHLPSPAIRAAVASPFDYAAQTRAFVVTDLAPGNLDQLAAAYRALFLASGGGGLGLFTAISRLRAVHARIAPELEQAGIPLYAQHVDAMGNATLVDIFRAEEESCLLGTDAMRDGVDVPGSALRLVVFERTPWPRPDILHRERRDASVGRRSERV